MIQDICLYELGICLDKQVNIALTKKLSKRKKGKGERMSFRYEKDNDNLGYLVA